MSIEQKAIKLCNEIDKLPDTLQAAQISVLADELKKDIGKIMSQIKVAQATFETSETPFYLGMKTLGEIDKVPE